jgi:hypothetical protein
VILTVGAGERVLETTVACARNVWGERLLAAYALGSLAHGGFSVHVSDLDVALVLRDPLEPSDDSGVSRVLSLAQEGQTPLADRLSIFWGSPATLTGRARGGRLPAADRLDLKQCGRLLAGEDLRGQLSKPMLEELVAEGAELALQKLASDAAIAVLRDPAVLLAAGATRLTKWLLFPVRLLFTLRTGNVAGVAIAVEHFSRTTRGPASRLASEALRWRHEPPQPDDPEANELLKLGVPPLYQCFFDEYEPSLREFGRVGLADAFHRWRYELARA